MRIVFLHLSDLHIENKQSIDHRRIAATIDTLKQFKPFEGIVLIISGDVAGKGEANNYKTVSHFLGSLLTGISKEYSLEEKNIKLLLVPGNHDILWGEDRDINPASIRELDNDSKTKEYFNELKRMDAFFAFSNGNKCFFHFLEGRSFTRKILHFSNNYLIEANLINTAPFSSSKDEGIHFLPKNLINNMSQSSIADMSIVVMHHSPDWFSFEQKRGLTQFITQRCSIAFYGHEHLLGAQNVTIDDGTKLLQQGGGAWWSKSTPDSCEFYAGVLETDSNDYSLKRFQWDPVQGLFTTKESHQTKLPHKRLNGVGLQYREEYVDALLIDSKHYISPKLTDYFVFSGINTDADEEYSYGHSISSLESFIGFIEENRYIAIIGGSNSGKTTLLKVLFSILRKKYLVLFCDTNDITGRKPQNIIKELVENTYGENRYDLFCAQDITEKIIIIDDANRIKEEHLNKFLRGLEKDFGTIIISSDMTTQFDIVQITKEQINSDRIFRKVTISKLFAEKRIELITKIAALKTDYRDNQLQSLVRTLEQYLNSYKLGFRTEIDFVAQFTNYYCDHIEELERADVSVFSKVFESSIERRIVPYLKTRVENVEDIIIALSEVAYYIHFNKEYPVEISHISEVINEYCKYYDNRYLTPDRFLEIAEKSGLLKRAVNGYEYRFASKNHLAYFVAKALNRKYYDNGDTSDLEKTVEQSCFGINGDILLFLTYISDNVNIPRLILDRALECVSGWKEFDLLNNEYRYLTDVKNKELAPPPPNQRKREIEQQSAEEEKRVADESVEILDIYDYDISKIDEWNNQLIRAFLQLQIVARNFSAFVSLLPAKDKQRYTTALYKLPNMIFGRWAESVDSNFDALLAEVVEWEKTDDYTGRKHTPAEIKTYFQNISTDLLLNLYYIVAIHGSNLNTADYLASQDFVSSSINYRIERMLILEKVDNLSKPIFDAERLHKEYDNGMIHNMIMSFFRHIIIYSIKLPDQERRRLTDKYFSTQGKTNLLVSRQKALKK